MLITGFFKYIIQAKKIILTCLRLISLVELMRRGNGFQIVGIYPFSSHRIDPSVCTRSKIRQKMLRTDHKSILRIEIRTMYFHKLLPLVVQTIQSKGELCRENTSFQIPLVVAILHYTATSSHICSSTISVFRFSIICVHNRVQLHFCILYQPRSFVFR